MTKRPRKERRMVKMEKVKMLPRLHREQRNICRIRKTGLRRSRITFKNDSTGSIFLKKKVHLHLNQGKVRELCKLPGKHMRWKLLKSDLRTKMESFRIWEPSTSFAVKEPVVTLRKMPKHRIKISK
jgi:hypothetical protein